MANPYALEIMVIDVLGADVIEADDIGTYAIELAVRGWRVFPLTGKIPAIANPHPRGSTERLTCKGECGQDGHGVLDATTDLDTVAGWWSGRYDGANIGVRLADDVVVIDVDPRNGGAESVATLTERYGPLPETLTAISGRGDGGCHRYYRRPFGTLTSKHLGAGIDVKTSAGYVVVPPSIHPDTGRAYTWVEHPIVDPPGWLVDLLRPPAPEPARAAHIAHNTHKAGAGFWSEFTGTSSLADDFCAATTWAQILDPHGWRCLDPDVDADGARWLHPAATSACSATIRHGCLFVYSDNTPFEPTTASAPHGYTRFRAHALLNHGGDLSAAARALRADGSF